MIMVSGTVQDVPVVTGESGKGTTIRSPVFEGGVGKKFFRFIIRPHESIVSSERGFPSPSWTPSYPSGGAS